MSQPILPHPVNSPSLPLALFTFALSGLQLLLVLFSSLVELSHALVVPPCTDQNSRRYRLPATCTSPTGTRGSQPTPISCTLRPKLSRLNSQVNYAKGTTRPELASCA